MMMIELLLSYGANINVRIDSGMGYTVLMKLVSSEILDYEKLNNTVEIIQFLIERGANTNLTGNDGKTVFDVVRSSNYKEEILNVLNNTKQIYFYLNNNDSSTSDKKKNSIINDFYDTNITKINCCHICNIF